MTSKRQNNSPAIDEIIKKRMSRRAFLTGSAGLVAASQLTGCKLWKNMFSDDDDQQNKSDKSFVSINFNEIAKNNSHTHALAKGYNLQRLISWGDPLFDSAREFSPLEITPEGQAKRFGYNNDYIAYLPLGKGEMASKQGLLAVNHEYANGYLMFDNMTYSNRISKITDEQVRVEFQALGCTVVEVAKDESDKWHLITDSKYNRRITATTPIEVGGPARGHKRIRTKSDPLGHTVHGTLSNCAGGVTPWNTVLTAEENFNYHFKGLKKDNPEYDNLSRLGIPEKSRYNAWWRVDDRFDVEKEPNEANRFGWVVEYDPYRPDLPPVKRTALGRFKHECANTTLAPDGRVVVYSGDDERYEYVYRFVSKKSYDPDNRDANRDLLDEGTLYVAKFEDDGALKWLPLTYGYGILDEEHGFYSQADIMIDTRKAADLLGATPMDRPEDIEVNPITGQIFLVLTNNHKREDDEVNPANPRADNIHGHIMIITPPESLTDKKGDHAADSFAWDILLKAGNPYDYSDKASYPVQPSKNGWLSCPDNIAFDKDGNLWICSDGQGDSINSNDGVYAMPIRGNKAGQTKLFMTVPVGAEVTGPAFTPDCSTLFLAVQHPGESREGSTFANPSTRWPDFKSDMPPRPSVVAITKKDGGIIGG